MTKYVVILVTALVFVGCHQPYQFENVGTTAAVPVLNKPKVAQAVPSAQDVDQKVAAAEKKMVKKTTKKPVAKKQKSIVISSEDMGTQDSDWVDIVADEVAAPAPVEEKPRRTVPYYLTPEYRNSIEK